MLNSCKYSTNLKGGNDGKSYSVFFVNIYCFYSPVMYNAKHSTLKKRNTHEKKYPATRYFGNI